MKIIIIKISLLFTLSSCVVYAQNPSEYYPMHVGDKWHYEYKEIGGGTVFTHYFYFKEVLSDTIMSNSKKYYKVRYKYFSDQTFEKNYFERFDSSNYKIVAYEDYLGCDGNDNDIYSLKTTASNQYWTSCCNMYYIISFQDSSSSDSLSYIIMDGDGLHTEYKKYAKNIGLIYDKWCEVTCNYSELVGYSIEGKTWGTLTGIDEQHFSKKDYQLKQNYPNPFNPTTIISYTIPERSYVKLRIYNFLGETISTLVDEITNAGTYSKVFDGKLLSSGIYYYQIETSNYREVKKMILIK